DGVLLNAEWNASRLQSLDGSYLAAQDRSVVSGVDVDQVAGFRMVLGEKRGGEAAAILTVGTCVGVHATDEFGQRARSNGERLQAGLEGAINMAAGTLLPATSAMAIRNAPPAELEDGRGKTS